MTTSVRLHSCACLLAAMIAAGTIPVRATDKPAVTFSNANSLYITGLNTEGWTFSVSRNVTVTALGFWDWEGNGLTSDHLVGIWDASGTLLASASVSSTNILRNGFRYAGIPALPLRAGNSYTIGAVQAGGSPDALAAQVSGFATDPAITFIRTVYGNGGGTLVRPTNQQPALDPAYFGPSFLIAGPCVCSGFDGSRSPDWSFTSGRYFSRLRERLGDGAFFGVDGRAPNPISLGPGFPNLGGGSLADIDVFFTGWTPSTTYTDLEKLSLTNLVKGGMNLVATVDDTDHNIADLFNVTLRNGGSDREIAAMPEHPIFAGPFGRVTRFRGAGVKGHFVAWPDDAQLLATNDLGQATMLLLPPGSGGRPADSGTVILIADTDVLTSYDRDLNAATATPDIPVTDAFALNLVAFLCNRWAPVSAPNLVFPQVANGAGNISALNVSNTGKTEAPVSWKFWSSSGSSFQLETNRGRASGFAFALKPNATGPSIVTDGKQGGIAQPQSGWAQVSGSPSLSGNVIFSVPGLGTTSVGASELAGGFLVPIVTQPTASGPQDAFTGIAIANLGPKATTVRLEVWDGNGSIRPDGVTTLSIPASGQVAKFLFELLPAFRFTGFTGSLRIVSLDGLIAVTGLQLGAKAGEFTALPVRPQYF